MNVPSHAGDSSRLEVSIARKAFRTGAGHEVEVLKDLAITGARGEVLVIVGPSGCGKTTLLRMICGLDTDYTGSVRLPAQGRLGVMFQEPRLLPWRSLRDNIRLAAPQIDDDALQELLKLLGLEAHMDHFPAQLSGGLARRAALARAFAVKPDLLILDEPFISLDAALATRLRDELADMIEQQPDMTTVLVTHDLDEAMRLADRIIFLSGSPTRIMAEVRIDLSRVGRTTADLAGVKSQIDRILQDPG